MGWARSGTDRVRVCFSRLFSALGFILSNALYASPLPALRKAVKRGNLGTLNPLPSALMVIGTGAWVSYGLSCQNPWISATNIPGAVVAMGQLLVMLPLMKSGAQLKQFQSVVLGGTACTLLLWAKLIFGGVSAAVRSQVLGTYAIICIVLFASPLSTIASVVKNKNAASILAPLTISQVSNCALWTTYGVFAARDIFVWGPNGIGLILGLAQLSLKLLFPSKEEEA